MVRGKDTVIGLRAVQVVEAVRGRGGGVAESRDTAGNLAPGQELNTADATLVHVSLIGIYFFINLPQVLCQRFDAEVMEKDGRA